MHFFAGIQVEYAGVNYANSSLPTSLNHKAGGETVACSLSRFFATLLAFFCHINRGVKYYFCIFGEGPTSRSSTNGFFFWEPDESTHNPKKPSSLAHFSLPFLLRKLHKETAYGKKKRSKEGYQYVLTWEAKWCKYHTNKPKYFVLSILLCADGSAKA